MLEVKNFDSKEDFEKILEGILFIANIQNPNSGEGYWGYHGYYIGDLLGKPNIIRQFYDDEKVEYKNYLEKLLLAKEIKFNSTNELVVSLLKGEYYHIESFFSKDELSAILLVYFERIIDSSTKLTPDLWWHYINSLKRKESAGHQYNVTNVSYSINEKATELMREFILNKDIDGFIRRIAIHKPTPADDSYIPSGLIDSVFGTKDEFCQTLKDYNGESIYKDEFLRFVEEFKRASIIQIGRTFPASYFNIIPVQKGFIED